MNDEIGLIVVAKRTNPEKASFVSYGKSKSHADRISNTITDFKEKYDGNVRVCVAVDSNKEIEVPEKTSVHFSRPWSLQRVVRTCLEEMKNAACQYTIILEAGLLLKDLSFMDNQKMTLCRPFLTPLAQREFASEFIFGKTKSLWRVFENRPFCKTFSIERNIYKNVENLVGEKGIKENNIVNTFTPEELGIVRS